MMRKLALGLIGIACSVHGRRVQSSVDQSNGAVQLEKKQTLTPSDGSHTPDSFAKVTGKDNVDMISGINQWGDSAQEQPADTGSARESLAKVSQPSPNLGASTRGMLAMLAIFFLIALSSLLYKHAIITIDRKARFKEEPNQRCDQENDGTTKQKEDAKTKQVDEPTRESGSTPSIKVKKILRKTRGEEAGSRQEEDKERQTDWETASSCSSVVSPDVKKIFSTSAVSTPKVLAAAPPLRKTFAREDQGAAANLAFMTNVLAVDSSGDTVAEFLISVNSTVKDLIASILKNANIKGSDHGIQLVFDDAKLTGPQVLRDVGMKPSTDSTVTVTITKKKTIKISFQPADAPKSEGYFIDSGNVFQDHGGLSYGWSHDTSDGCRKRNRHADPVQDTFIIPDRKGKYDGELHWKIALSPGDYEVTLGFADNNSFGRKDSNCGTMNGRPFDASKSFNPSKEVTMDMDVQGKYLRLVGSYPNLSALSYISICGPPQRAFGSSAVDLTSKPDMSLYTW
jgi:hypothetical protein